MKSRAELLKATYRGILKDATCTYPDRAHEFARDYVRLQTIIDRNEIWFFTIFLPSLSKHLTRCVDAGVFHPFPGPHMRLKRGCQYPKLFSGLTELVFDNRGILREEADSTTLQILQTLLVAAKKLRMECDDTTVRETVRSFVLVEEDVRHYTLNWGDDILRHDSGIGIVGDDLAPGSSEAAGLHNQLYAGNTDLLPYLGYIQSVSDQIVSSFGDVFTTLLRPRHGPGAIADRRDNPTKYQFSNWSAKLEHCFPASVFGQPNAGYWLQPVLDTDPCQRFRHITVPSKLIAVPKTQKGPRLIAAEPNANMWMQQAVLDYLEDVVGKSPLRNCVNFRNQRLSGELALKASLDKMHSTIDLSDASDRLSCWLIERLFRRNLSLLQAFNAVRTDSLSIPVEMGKEFPRKISLKKFSTQGSALTFPVQTIVYAIICIGVVLADSSKRVNRRTIEWASKKVRLYGDDIIVPTELTGRVIECLTALGFKVNVSKTFQEGNFRESCGVDGFKGGVCTPSYILEPYDRAKPGSVASLVECSNNFFMKGLWHAAEEIKLTIPPEVRKRIPIVGLTPDYEEGDLSRAFGFVSYSGGDFGSNHSRWNRDLHRYETKVLSLSAKVVKDRIRGDFALLQYFTERPSPHDMWEHGEARRPKPTMKLRWVAVETLRMGGPTSLNLAA